MHFRVNIKIKVLNIMLYYEFINIIESQFLIQ